MPFRELLGHVIAQRHAHARDFQTVGETVVHEDAARKGEYLSLVLQAAEGGGENQPVAVTLEFRAVVVTLWMTVFLPETFVGYQLLPVHDGEISVLSDRVTETTEVVSAPLDESCKSKLK